MRVESMTGGILRTPHRYRDGMYRCFPRSENRKPFARAFATVSDASLFLRANAGWGIRMREGYAIIYRDLRFVP
jgi:hypothetical protein